MLFNLCLASVLFFWLLIPYSFAEDPSDTNQSNASQGPAKADTVSAPQWRWNGSVRSRLEGWDWFKPSPGSSEVSNDYAFLGTYLRLSLARTIGRADFFVEGSLPLLVGLPENASLPPPQGQLGHGASYRDANGDRVLFPFVRQAYARIARLPDTKSTLRLGRFEFIEGLEGVGEDPTLDWIKRERIAQRLIAHFAFTHVQRTNDGVELARSSGSWHLLAAAARPTEGVFKLDANGGVSKVLFTYAGVTRATPIQNLRLFHIFYHDSRSATKVDDRPAPLRVADTEPIDISTAGAHYARRFGRADMLLYGAVQTGNWGVQSHRAGAWVVEMGYQPALPGQPWFRAGFNQGSGDGNASDDRHGTFFQMMPTARLYARFPFFNMMNLEDAFLQAIVRPHPRLTLRTDFHHLRLSSSTDLWYAGGGAFEARSFGFAGRPASGLRNLASLGDLQADFRPDERTVLSLYYGHAQGGNVIKSIYPAGAKGNLVFFELSRRF